MINTEKAVFKVSENELELIEIAMGQSIDEIKKATGDTFSVSKNLKEF